MISNDTHLKHFMCSTSLYSCVIVAACQLLIEIQLNLFCYCKIGHHQRSITIIRVSVDTLYPFESQMVAFLQPPAAHARALSNGYERNTLAAIFACLNFEP